MRWFLLHLPHLLPILMGFAVLVKLALWVLDQPPAHLNDRELEAWRAQHAEREQRRRARREIARAGLLALVPLLLALASGLVIYTINLGQARPGGGLIWTHVVVSLLALALVAVKLREVGLRSLREGLDASQVLAAGSSLLLALVLVPLLITGVVLLIDPSKSGFWAYFHLIASAWWTVLFSWHLWRHFVRAVQAAVEPDEGATPGRSAPASPA